MAAGGEGWSCLQVQERVFFRFFFSNHDILPMRINITFWMKSVHPMLEVVYSQRRPVADSAHRYFGDMSAPQENIPRNCGGAT